MAYSFYRTITIDHTNVGSTDWTNGVVLIQGTYSWMKNQSNGGEVNTTLVTQTLSGRSLSVPADLIFTSDAAGVTKLNWEYEDYHAGTGVVAIWVQVPTISHTTDTVIYCFTGNAAVTTYQGNITATWDSVYKGVYHFPDGNTLHPEDSSAAANHGTLVNTPVAGTGRNTEGGATFATASSQKITASSIAALSSTAQFTLEMWSVRASGVGGSVGQFLTSSTCISFVYDGSTIYAFFDNGGTNYASFTVTDTVFKQFVLTFDGSQTGNANRCKIYVNGASQTLTFVGTIPSILGNNLAGTFNIGFDALNTIYCNGTMDEVRVHNVVRQVDWVLANFNAQNSPSTFYTISAQFANGAPFPPIPSNFIIELSSLIAQ